jgi:hypothetical protein
MAALEAERFLAAQPEPEPTAESEHRATAEVG